MAWEGVAVAGLQVYVRVSMSIEREARFILRTCTCIYNTAAAIPPSRVNTCMRTHRKVGVKKIDSNLSSNRRVDGRVDRRGLAQPLQGVHRGERTYTV